MRTNCCILRAILASLVACEPIGAFSWNTSSLGFYPADGKVPTVDQLRGVGSIDVFRDSCMVGADAAGHTKKQLSTTEAKPGQRKLSGTTFWINEHQAVGHASYDIMIMQLLHTTKVDRVVLQRAPCLTRDLCQGRGTWESFYKPFYTTMMDSVNGNSARSITPVFLRLQADRHWKSQYLSAYPSRIPLENDREGNLSAEKTMCFDRIIRQKCHSCFEKGLSAQATRAFKLAAFNYPAALCMSKAGAAGGGGIEKETTESSSPKVSDKNTASTTDQTTTIIRPLPSANSSSNSSSNQKDGVSTRRLQQQQHHTLPPLPARGGGPYPAVLHHGPPPSRGSGMRSSSNNQQPPPQQQQQLQRQLGDSSASASPAGAKRAGSSSSSLPSNSKESSDAVSTGSSTLSTTTSRDRGLLAPVGGNTARKTALSSTESDITATDVPPAHPPPTLSAACQKHSLPYQRSKSDEIFVIIAHRGKHYRTMADPEAIANATRFAIKENINSDQKISIELLDTTQMGGYEFEKLVKEMHRFQVVISSHGAFSSNLIYMREGTLFVELCGEKKEFEPMCMEYHRLANSFLVHHHILWLEDLKDDRQPNYKIDHREMKEITDVVASYLKASPWSKTIN